MATDGRPAAPDLISVLAAEGPRFDFYQAVRLLEQHRPEAESVGAGVLPDREAVRFRSAVGFAVTSSDVAQVEGEAPPAAPSARALMTVNFLGLAGAQGPLPAVDTQLLIDRLRDGDDVLRDFLDIFNHRLVSLLYRVRKTQRAGFAYTTPEGDPASRYLLSLVGLGTPALRRRLGVPDKALPRFAGLLAHYPRSAAGLQAMLGAYFEVGVEIRQLQGRWILLEADEQSAIGLSGRNQRLGRDLLLGRWFFDVAGRLEIRLGPLGLRAFLDLLPGGSGFRELRDLTRLYLGDAARVDVGLTLAGAEVPVSRLGSAGSAQGPRLGWTTWLKTRPGGTSPAYVALRGPA
jgi:type VI secretion system protein ImpH